MDSELTEEEQLELARLQKAVVNKGSVQPNSPGRSSGFRPNFNREPSISEKPAAPAVSSPAKGPTKVLDPEQIKRIEEMERQREAQRLQEERIDSVMSKKVATEDQGIESFLKEMQTDQPRQKKKVGFDVPAVTPRTAEPALAAGSALDPDDEEEKEALRLLKTMSGRKLFGKAGNQLQSKSLKQLEEDRETWRKREEAKLQVEKEEILRKQQEEQRRADMERQIAADEAFFKKQAEERAENEKREAERRAAEAEAQRQREAEARAPTHVPTPRPPPQQEHIDEEEPPIWTPPGQAAKPAPAAAPAGGAKARPVGALHGALNQFTTLAGYTEEHGPSAAAPAARPSGNNHHHAPEPVHHTPAPTPAPVQHHAPVDQDNPAEELDDLIAEFQAAPAPSPKPAAAPKAPEAPVQVADNSQSQELVKELTRLRELLPYYTDKPKANNVGVFLVEHSKVAAFLRGAVYLYPAGCATIAKSFGYKDFADAVSGFIKFFIDNLNFLTFEDDRKTIVKAADGLLQVGILFVNLLPSATTLNADLLKVQLKWEAVINVLVNTVVKACNQKAIVEERREKIRRVITSTILKVQVLLTKMMEILGERPFDYPVFKKLLAKLVSIYSETHPFLTEKTKATLVDYTRLILKVSKVFEEGKVYPKDRSSFEKHVVLTVNHLLGFRDSI